MFSGTVRTNLDPFEQHNDDRLWEVLEAVGLKPAISALDGGLGAKVVDNGANFSLVGVLDGVQAHSIPEALRFGAPCCVRAAAHSSTRRPSVCAAPWLCLCARRASGSSSAWRAPCCATVRS